MSILTTGHEILTGSIDGRVRRYDLRMGQLQQDYIGKPVTSVCFTNDSQCILLSTLDNCVMLFDKDTGEMLSEYKGHKNSEFRCDSCLNAKDTHVLSGSEDGNVYCWDLIVGKEPVQVMNHGGGNLVITAVSHHPKQPCFVSAAQNKLFVWKGVEE